LVSDETARAVSRFPTARPALGTLGNERRGERMGVRSNRRFRVGILTFSDGGSSPTTSNTRSPKHSMTGSFRPWKPPARSSACREKSSGQARNTSWTTVSRAASGPKRACPAL
jgi:hypothetical protein